MARQWAEMDEYVPPTEQGIKNAIAHGVKEKYAKLGFDIFESNCGTFVRRLYFAYETNKGKNVPSFEACAEQAKTLGLCEIIPVKKLPDYMPNDMRQAIWVDTPDNRMKIQNYFSYRKVLYK